MATSSYSFENQDGLSVNSGHPGASDIETAGDFDNSQYAVETIDSFARFEEIDAAWNDLFERAAEPKNVFQSYNWHWHWCRHYLKNNDSSIRIIALWADDRLMMIWPMAIDRSMGVRQLKWMGAPVSQYGDIIVDGTIRNSGLIERVWAYIIRHIRVDLVSLEKVRSDSPVSTLLKAQGAITTDCQEAPYLDLASAETYDDYEMRYSGRARKNRRRHRRRLEELGPVEFKTIESGEEAGELVAKTINVKRQWLKEKGLVSRAYGDEKFDAFFKDVASSKDRSCGCLVSVISSSGKPVGFDVGFQTGDNFVAHIGAYDLEFERFGVGSLVTEDLFRDCYGRGIKNFDFLAPQAAYKKMWADGSITVCDHSYPLNGRGYAYAKGVKWFLRNAIKKILERSPELLRKMARPLFSIAGF